MKNKTFDSFSINKTTFRNRIAMSPMCMYSAHDGFANDWHTKHYEARAIGGVGLAVVEATAVSAQGRITPRDIGIWDDAHISALSDIATALKQNGAVAGIQIAHAGRKASHAAPFDGGKQLEIAEGGWDCVAPSAIAFEPGERLPLALSVSQIADHVALFRDAAVRARTAGFQFLEIHAAHGYLLQSFLSPLSNKRTDEYGGNFGNRCRFLYEVIAAVREVWPTDLVLAVRISASEWTLGGWTVDDSVRLAFELKNKGVDLVDCSSGGNVYNARIPVGPAYQLSFSEAVKATGMATATVGLFSKIAQIDSVIANAQADIVMLGRELLRNPYFCLQNVPAELRASICPKQYLRGF